MRSVARRTLSPHIQWNKEFLTTMVAVFGTTISPYLCFWQASQEVEELHSDPAAEPLKHAPRQVRPQLRRIKLDTAIGMGFSNLVAWSIMLTTAVTLHAHGIFHVGSSAQAAAALRPIAGELAFALFGLGIIGTGLLAIPVLPVNIEHSSRQHSEIVTAILSGHAQAARRAMESHCDDTAALLRGLLR